MPSRVPGPPPLSFSPLLPPGEPALVAASCQLLVLVLSHNRPALSRLYTTGAFFFALAYCGSNLEEVAMLLKVAHLVQAHRWVGTVVYGREGSCVECSRQLELQ